MVDRAPKAGSVIVDLPMPKDGGFTDLPMPKPGGPGDLPAPKVCGLVSRRDSHVRGGGTLPRRGALS